MSRKTFLVREEHIPEKAAFPAIDAHNHLWGNHDAGGIVETLDRVGVDTFCDVTGNVRVEFGGGGYTIGHGDIDDFFNHCAIPHPGRFYCFTMADFARPAGKPLFRDARRFVEECIETLHRHHEKGALGLKVLKELGLHFRDAGGRLIHTDDERLAPIWEEAGRLKMPVLIHQADPSGFFEPVTPDNEHHDSLMKFPSWSFADERFPRKEALLARRDNLVRSHPGTTFILPHLANHAENLGYVSRLLDELPNVYIDFSARLDELGRQPYTARELFIRHQDRILFGTDMPANIDSSIGMYRTYFRFLETYDEAFFSPDYDGTFDRARWPICGIGLPPEVLRKIYRDNILHVIPDLNNILK